MWEKLKSFLANDALFYGVLLITISVTSFGLGRQSVLEGKTEKTVEKQEESMDALAAAPIPLVDTSEAVNNTGGVVASKSGTKYHLPTCSGASRIKPENLISFASAAAAEAAGYSPAGNCPGLQ